MNVQIASDLHIEYTTGDISAADYIIPKAPILILAGDIGSLYKHEQLEKFLKELAPKFKYILYTPGNHEFYMQNDYKPLPFRKLIQRLYTLENKISNLYILNRSSVIIGNICFIGSTLWSQIPKDGIIPHFRLRIKGFSNFLYRNNHQKDVNYIAETIQYSQQKNLKICVITHYPPSNNCLGPLHEKDKYKYLYSSDLENLLTGVNTWISGHVHWNYKMKIGDTYLIANQKGRERDRVQDFSKEFVWKID